MLATLVPCPFPENHMLLLCLEIYIVPYNGTIAIPEFVLRMVHPGMHQGPVERIVGVQCIAVSPSVWVEIVFCHLASCYWSALE